MIQEAPGLAGWTSNDFSSVWGSHDEALIRPKRSDLTLCESAVSKPEPRQQTIKNPGSSTPDTDLVDLGDIQGQYDSSICVFSHSEVG